MPSRHQTFNWLRDILWTFAEFCDVYAIESDFEAKVEAEFKKMIESATAQRKEAKP